MLSNVTGLAQAAKSKGLRAIILILASTFFALDASWAQDLTWPQEISSDEGTLVIYQPQTEALEGNQLTARAALSIELAGKEDAIFGAMWFTSRIETDQDAGTATILDIKVTKVGWPDSKDAGEQRLMQIVEGAFPDHGLELSLARLSASLETADIERKSLENLNDTPPEILFRDTLSVLLIFDGEPQFQEVENSPYERAVNTPFLVARKGRAELYLSDGVHWYSAADPLGPWSPTTNPPKDLAQMVAEASEDGPAAGTAAGPAPAIVVATVPTELISTDGKADWQSLAGGEILYVKNTESPWLRYLPSGNMYVLLSGRWYRSKSEAGPWTFVPATELPEAFAQIPPASDIGGLRVSVAGTEEAEEAMLDAAIPQTAVIDRKEATLTVTYDGAPKFEKIKGTDVSYAVNTASQVLEIDKVYYAVDNGVWFQSLSAQGPWIVADDVPEDEIAKIPADSPVYNVTHVHVYDSTPEVVYVGYTPGYLWSYPYYGVPVYGTGWYYPPYWGGFYYPRPPTWGFHVGYNPWTGWNFGVSWSNGFFSLGVSWGGGWGCCGGGWYGGGYRGPTFINTGDINIGNTINVGNRTEISNRIGDSSLNIGDRNRNIYRDDSNRDRLASRGQRDELRRARPTTERANNVFADRDGNVARKVDGAWEQRSNGQWSRENLSSASNLSRDTLSNAAARRPSTGSLSTNRSTSSGFDRSSFERANRARSRGAAREMRRPARGRRR